MKRKYFVAVGLAQIKLRLLRLEEYRLTDCVGVLLHMWVSICLC